MCLVRVVKILIFSLVLLEFTIHGVITQNQCSLQNGQCTYNIQLSHLQDECTGVQGKATRSGEVQNDNARVQQDLEVVKTDHENRLRELEASVQKILRSAVSGTSEQTIVLSEGGVNLPQLRNRTENSLLTRLHQEFSKLRSQLSKRNVELAETYRKLNESAVLLVEAQEDLFETGERLITAEHKAATYEQEGYILKNKIKHATSRYTVAEEKFNVSETKRISLENQLYALVRSEANLKEELQLYKFRLNKTMNLVEELKRNNSYLKHLYEETKANLKQTEYELMDCYTAKTQTFCGFEDNHICGFTQEDATDDFDWERTRGRTKSTGTGPLHDHTCRSPQYGYYMYIESSAKLKGKKARMYSPVYRGLNPQCVEFFYHMYGRHVGTLNVYTKTESNAELNSAWAAFGNQGNVWIKARLAIPKILSRQGYQIVFEGITELGYLGDMAIDDVLVTDGACRRGKISPIRVAANVNNSTQTAVRKMKQYRRLLRQLHNKRRQNRKGNTTSNNSDDN